MKSMKLATKIFLAVTGVLLAAAGILCLANPLGAVSTIAWLIGLVLLVSGIGTAIYYFMFGSFLVFAFPLLLNAIGHILFGVIFLQHPDGTSRVLIVLYGMLLILVGLAAAAVAFVARNFVQNKAVFTGILVVGLVAIVLGIVALTSDAAGAFLVAIPVGLALVLMGVGYIALDVAFIRMDKAGETPKYFKDVDDVPKEA
ncbi:MAG: DUF308 domain-containing protein [Acutalibacteraceae bacterium]|nr:DUF308 domain-containing protein [Acutalibacteraceae bacterium]